MQNLTQHINYSALGCYYIGVDESNFQPVQEAAKGTG
jgi:hypothetical protein